MASVSASLESATRGAKSSAALEFLKSSPKKLLINGKWVPSKSGKTFETLNPANEQVLALVAEGDKDDVDEAVTLANDTEYGLVSYVYTHDVGRIFRVSEALEAGMVAVNTGRVSNEQAPFGGIKESGLGREGSKYGLDDWLDLKYINLTGLSRRTKG